VTAANFKAVAPAFVFHCHFHGPCANWSANTDTEEKHAPRHCICIRLVPKCTDGPPFTGHLDLVFCSLSRFGSSLVLACFPVHIVIGGIFSVLVASRRRLRFGNHQALCCFGGAPFRPHSQCATIPRGEWLYHRYCSFISQSPYLLRGSLLTSHLLVHHSRLFLPSIVDSNRTMFTTDNFVYYSQASDCPADFMLQPNSSPANISGSVSSKRSNQFKPENFVPYSHDTDALAECVVPPWSPDTDTSGDQDDALPDSDTTCIQLQMHLNDPNTYGRKLARTVQIANSAPHANMELSVHIINSMTIAQMRAAAAMCMEDMVFRFRARLTFLQLALDATGLGLFLGLPPLSFPLLHTIHFTIEEHYNAKWFVPSRKTLTPPTQMHQIVPGLASFTLNMDAPDRCYSELDPFDLGLDFSRLYELDLQIGVSQESAHLMLRSCHVLWKCTLHIGPWPVGCWFAEDGESDEEMEDVEGEWDDEFNHRRREESAKEIPILLPNLTHFKVDVHSDHALYTFLQPLKIPDLTSFTLEATGVRVKDFQGILIDLCQRSRVVLKTLRLHNIGNLTQDTMEKLLRHQQRLKYLEVYSCRGDFWAVLSRNITLIPRLKCLRCLCFSEAQVESLVRFIDSRCDASSELKEIMLDPLRSDAPRPESESLTDSTFNWFMEKTEHWRAKGLQITVKCPSSGDPAIDEDEEGYLKEDSEDEDDTSNTEDDESKTAQGSSSENKQSVYTRNYFID
ncbi:hypothetical protein C8R43DRAFT_270911, partial [Mycena crocata]